MLTQAVLIVISSLIVGVAGASDLGDIVRVKDLKNADIQKYCAKVTDDGRCLMVPTRAIAYCKALGKHLPSIREWALISTQSGAKGILEKNERKQKKAAGEDVRDYYRVVSSSQNPDFVDDFYLSDDFYFSHDGYVRPSDVKGENHFWTTKYNFWASTRSGFKPQDNAHFFNEYTGELGYTSHYSEYSVRCVEDL